MVMGPSCGLVLGDLGAGFFPTFNLTTLLRGFRGSLRV
jgi:hypothetical protein